MLTVFSHAKLPTNTKNWVEVDTDRFNCKKYKRVMKCTERFKILSLISVYTLFSLGLYILRLKCTQKGMIDLKNLRKRKIVHYVSNTKIKNELTKADFIDTNTKQYFSTKEQIHKKNLRVKKEAIKLEQQQKKLKNPKGKNVRLLSNAIKDCMKEALEYREIRKNIEALSENQRIQFLQKIFDKNQKLAESLEKYYALEEYETGNLKFIQTLFPALSNKETYKHLQDTIEDLKKLKKDQKTEVHKKFEEFCSIFIDMEKPFEWLITIYSKEDLSFYRFVSALFEIGDRFSIKLCSLYHNNEANFKKCLEMMKKNFSVNKEKVDLVIKLHEQSSQIVKQLNNNLNQTETPLYYSLKNHFALQLEELGLTEKVLDAIESNEYSGFFIEEVLSGRLEKVLKDVEIFINKPNHLELATHTCRKKIQSWEKQEKLIKEKLQLNETKQALLLLEKFLEDPVYDNVSILAESEGLIRLRYKDFFDEEFFLFLKTIKSAQFFKKPSKPNLDNHFYRNFSPFFLRLDHFLTNSLLNS